MHCHACWPRFCHDTFALLALNFYGVACNNNYKNNVSIHATCIHTFVQRLWLPRQAARRRSCCNLYAKLFYKLSKKDGVSRKHSRCCTHTHSYTYGCKLVQSGANKLACRISLDFSVSINCNSKRASASAWACRLSEILIDTHSLFCQIPCRFTIV